MFQVLHDRTWIGNEEMLGFLQALQEMAKQKKWENVQNMDEEMPSRKCDIFDG